MSSETDNPVVLSATCEVCARPIFPAKPGSASSFLHRPGFCNCALRPPIQSAPTSTGDAWEAALGRPVAIAPADPGHKIKLPSGSGESPKPTGTNIGLDQQAVLARQAFDAVRAPGARFDPANQTPDLIQKGYTFYERVGKGSMGYVYQAKSPNIDSLLAVKIFHRSPFQNKRTFKRLEQEVSLAMKIAHPHLTSVYNFGITQKEYPYLVMDFMAGPSLADTLKHEGFLDPPRAIDLFIQIAEALEYAHSEKLLHRGIKPSNIFLLPTQDGRDFVKVSDFGVAKVLPNAGRETKYEMPQGQAFGDTTYMSPEQCIGQRLDAASDIYSLGCVMYESLCGKPPFSSPNLARMAHKHLTELPKSLVERFHDLDIPEILDEIILVCLEKNRQHRFASAKELRLALLDARENKWPILPGDSLPGGRKKGPGLFDKVVRLFTGSRGHDSGTEYDTDEELNA